MLKTCKVSFAAAIAAGSLALFVTPVLAVDTVKTTIGTTIDSSELNDVSVARTLPLPGAYPGSEFTSPDNAKWQNRENTFSNTRDIRGLSEFDPLSSAFASHEPTFNSLGHTLQDPTPAFAHGKSEAWTPSLPHSVDFSAQGFSHTQVSAPALSVARSDGVALPSFGPGTLPGITQIGTTGNFITTGEPTPTAVPGLHVTVPGSSQPTMPSTWSTFSLPGITQTRTTSNLLTTGEPTPTAVPELHVTVPGSLGPTLPSTWSTSNLPQITRNDWTGKLLTTGKATSIMAPNVHITIPGSSSPMLPSDTPLQFRGSSVTPTFVTSLRPDCPPPSLNLRTTLNLRPLKEPAPHLLGSRYKF